MKIIFFGTGEFGIPTLERLVESEHEVVAVVTRPDREKGRGLKVRSSPVKQFVEQPGVDIELLQPEKVSDAGFVSYVKAKKADVFIVVDYGRFLNKDLLEAPEKGCINLHPSLLPRYRGAAPVNWAVLNGDRETGNTVIKLTERMDAGKIIVQEKIAIDDGENAFELSEKLSKSGAGLVLKALEVIEKHEERFKDQDESAASYAPRLEKKQGEIEWKEASDKIVNKVRGMQPWPGAYTYLNGKMLKILKAQVATDIEDRGEPGLICDKERFIVLTGDGAVEVEEVQAEGKRAMRRDEFLRGQKVEKGTVLGN
jgi:methionyl-tRNA formyltransferase